METEIILWTSQENTTTQTILLVSDAVQLLTFIQLVTFNNKAHRKSNEFQKYIYNSRKLRNIKSYILAMSVLDLGTCL